MTDRIIKDTDFKMMSGSVKPDAKKRILLRQVKVPEGVSYHIYANSLGQIVLDPQVTIPASEAWLWQNPQAIDAVRRGLDQASKGKVARINMDEL